MSGLPAPVSLRPATPEDLPFAFLVYASTRQEELRALGWNADAQEAFLRMQFDVRGRGYAAAYPTAEHSILLQENVPVGTMIVFRGASEVRLVDIALLPEHRNRGIGSYLLGQVLIESEAARVPLRLSVLRGNPAIRLYRRAGLVVRSEDAMYLEMEHEA